MAPGVVNETWFGDGNPNRLVPTIEDDGVVLWESNAVVRYLAGKYALDRLMPKDAVTRVRAEMWMAWQNTVMPGLSPLFLGLVRTPPEQRDAQRIRASAESVEAAFQIVDGHLAGRSYMVADHLTIADIPLGCAVHRYYALAIDHADFPNLRAWYERLTARPGFAAHVMLPLT